MRANRLSKGPIDVVNGDRLIEMIPRDRIVTARFVDNEAIARRSPGILSSFHTECAVNG